MPKKAINNDSAKVGLNNASKAIKKEAKSSAKKDALA